MTFPPSKKKLLSLYVFWCCIHWRRYDEHGNTGGSSA